MEQSGTLKGRLHFLLVLSCTFALLPALALAETNPQEPPVLFPESVDTRHEVVSEKLNAFVNAIDEFFGSERVLEESRGSYFKVSLYNVHHEGGKNVLKGNLYAKVALPRTEDRLKLLITSDADLENTEADGLGTELATAEASETPQSAALRYVVRESADWNIHADTGIRFRGGVDPFARYRIRRSLPLGDWVFHFAETLFWFESDGVGARTHVDFSLPVMAESLLRATSEATWYHDQQAFDLLQRIELLHRISTQRSVIYQASAFGLSEPYIHTTGTRLAIRLRQAVHRDWVFFEIRPQIDYKKEDGFDADKTLTLQLEAIF